MPENDSPQPRPRFSRLAVLSALCIPAISGVLLIAMAFDGGFGTVHPIMPHVFMAVFHGLLLAIPVLGILALIAIARSNGTLRGTQLALLLTIAVPSLFTLATMPAVLGQNWGMSERLDCAANLKSIGEAITKYASTHGDLLPTSEGWCDSLIISAGISPELLRCERGEAYFGESCYVLNSAIVDMRFSAMPPDVVLAFELPPATTDYAHYRSDATAPLSSRASFTSWTIPSHCKPDDKVRPAAWNQVGGADMVAPRNHFGGSNVLFSDGHVEFIRAGTLPLLRWKPDEAARWSWSRAYSNSIEIRYGVLGVIGVVMLGFTVALIIRCRQRGWLPMAAIMAVLSGGAGMLLGFPSGWTYLHHFGGHDYAGPLAGAIVGIWAGVCYAILVHSSLPRSGRVSDGRLHAVAVGMATGLIASSLIHLALMILWDNFQSGSRIFMGMPFGIVAGIALGGIRAAFIRPNNGIAVEISDA